ncbi:hypothetical protein MSG28_009714 [Choristoneura fumiferana]|uniref:Uncharacterized protein n=1 Tax=Choristoneura fumiferana TaxID=7141 RepID=A0ACC0JC99_CHOFU|nr:hypothetical protein MSG28_009714 [Choristoneura fumiferana]
MELEESTETDSEGDNERKERKRPKFRKVIINFYPDANEIAAAYAKVLKYYNWESFVIFKELSGMQESRFLMDCHVDRIPSYLKVAASLNMINPYQHYVLTSMDANMVVQELLKYSSNFTWLSLMDYESLKDPQHYLTVRVGKWTKYNAIPPPPVTNFPTTALLMDDVANHVLKSMAEIDTQGTFTCSPNGRPWRYGAKLQDKILKKKSTGITGNITFDENGRRTNYSLNVNEIYQMQIRRIASWESKSGKILFTEKFREIERNMSSAKHFTVMSRMAEPYFQIKKKCTVEPCEEDEYPDEEYEGFSVDLQADLVVCDLTITERRKKIVDFSVPFMTLGISILFTKDVKVEPEIFSFLKPYSVEMWIYTGTAYCVVSIVLFVCSRAFGSRWVCAMWWFFAMIVCQTYIAQLAASMTTAMENAPIESVEDLAKQTKVLYGAFESGSTLDFFKDKMFRKMYENMLANPGVLVESNEKGEQTVKKGRNKYAFFMESVTIEYKQKRDCALRKVGGVLVESNEKGEQTVKKGRNKYAFFMESVTIEYKQKRDCALRKVGGELDSKDYGIAMPANSPFRSDINRAILKLKENNKLNDIKDKWWNSKKYGAKECPELKASLNFLQLQKPVIRNPSRAPSVASSEKSNKSKKQAQFIENFLELEKEQL